MRGTKSDIDKADRLEQYLKGRQHTRGSRVNKTIGSKGITSNKPCYVTSGIDLMKPELGEQTER